MSFMNPTDMVEEDAADLQFPKEDDCINLEPSEQTKHTVQYYKPQFVASPVEIDSAEGNCELCKEILTIPYIKCPECSIKICLKCLSNGRESNKHRNTHSYIITHDNIQVFSKENWNAADEKLFLNLILTHGYGNWDAISRGIYSKTPEECREHYHTCYFDGIYEKMLGLSNNLYFPERIPYLFKMDSIDPPRFNNIESINFKNMAGYRCARGDFDTPYDNSAESLISNLDNDFRDWPSEHREIADELQCAILKVYNNRLSERQRRYKIMRENGLLVANRTFGWIAKYAEALEPPSINGVKSGGRFLAFIQIASGMKFDMLVEGLQHFTDMKKYLFKLYELRSNGVKTIHGGKIYYKLKEKRIVQSRNKKFEQYKQLLDWKHLVPAENQHQSGNFFYPQIQVSNPRKKAGPIEIIGLPAYDKLTEEERNLCSVARLMPAAFLEYKNLLTAENSKIGYLRLADARRLVKIDVNKTRQIYDFLLNNGHINKPF